MRNTCRPAFSVRACRNLTDSSGTGLSPSTSPLRWSIGRKTMPIGRPDKLRNGSPIAGYFGRRVGSANSEPGFRHTEPRCQGVFDHHGGVGWGAWGRGRAQTNIEVKLPRTRWRRQPKRPRMPAFPGAVSSGCGRVKQLETIREYSCREGPMLTEI